MLERTRRFFGNRASRTTNYVKRVVNNDEIQKNRHWISDMWRALTESPKRKREESFQNAYQRLGLDEVKLAQTHKLYIFRFYLFSVLAFVALGLGAHAVAVQSWVALGPTIGLFGVAVSRMFDASFRLYQIERRELVDISCWWRARGSWIPAPFHSAASTQSSTQATSTAIRSLPKQPRARPPAKR